MMHLPPITMQQDRTIGMQMVKNDFDARPYEFHVGICIFKQILKRSAIASFHRAAHAEWRIEIGKVCIQRFQCPQNVKTVAMMKRRFHGLMLSDVL